MLQLTKEHVDAGFMTVDGLCAAAIVWSDNTAARTARRSIGWTRYVRSLGDTISRLDRTEPDLNTAIAGDPRTITPDAVARRSLEWLVGRRQVGIGRSWDPK
jgi:beta-lactamase class A